MIQAFAIIAGAMLFFGGNYWLGGALMAGGLFFGWLEDVT